MRYLIRSIKYFIYLCVLLAAIVYLMTFSYPEAAGLDFWTMLRVQLFSKEGIWLSVGVVLLAAAYPRFGFISSRIEGCDIERDALRIDNAMVVSGFRLIDESATCRVYRAVGPVQRLLMLFEDRIEVRADEGGVVITGLRRQVVRIAIRLKGYMHNSRYEE